MKTLAEKYLSALNASHAVLSDAKICVRKLKKSSKSVFTPTNHHCQWHRELYLVEKNIRNGWISSMDLADVDGLFSCFQAKN